MKKEARGYHNYENPADAPNDPSDYIVTREDLEGEEISIYDRYLAKLGHPTNDQLRMLATYAWLAVEFKKAAQNKELALYIHRCMIFARNRLGLWISQPVDYFELLLDDGQDFEMTFFYLYLDRAWQVL